MEEGFCSEKLETLGPPRRGGLWRVEGFSRRLLCVVPISLRLGPFSQTFEDHIIKHELLMNQHKSVRQAWIILNRYETIILSSLRY